MVTALGEFTRIIGEFLSTLFSHALDLSSVIAEVIMLMLVLAAWRIVS